MALSEPSSRLYKAFRAGARRAWKALDRFRDWWVFVGHQLRKTPEPKDGPDFVGKAGRVNGISQSKF